jgi:hypothetical protein
MAKSAVAVELKRALARVEELRLTDPERAAFIEETYRDLDNFFLHAKVSALTTLVENKATGLYGTYSSFRNYMENWFKVTDERMFDQLREVHALDSEQEAVTGLLHGAVGIPIAVFSYLAWAIDQVTSQKAMERRAWRTDDGNSESTEEHQEGSDGGNGAEAQHDVGGAEPGDAGGHEELVPEGPPEI